MATVSRSRSHVFFEIADAVDGSIRCGRSDYLDRGGSALKTDHGFRLLQQKWQGGRAPASRDASIASG